MPNAQYGVSTTIGGSQITKTVTRTGDAAKIYEVALPAADAGTLSTRASDTAGTLTLGAGHSIETGDIIDIFWTTGSGGVAYGCTAGTVSGNDVPFTLASGDVLPSQDDPITCDQQVIINTTLDGDNVKILSIVLDISDSTSTAAGHLDMQDSGAASIEEIDLVANAPRVYDITGGDTNVFTGNVIETTHAGNGDATNAATIKIHSLEDNTP